MSVLYRSVGGALIECPPMDRLTRLFDGFAILEPEDDSTFSPFERKARATWNIFLKCIVALVLSWHIFDFLFSAVWMHGYIWSLNLPIDLDLSDKSAGSIVYHQREIVGPTERIIHAFGAVSATIILLVCSGFASERTQNVWELVRLSLMMGIVVATVRPCQMRQRLFSSLHEGFYVEFLIFVIGLILTLRSKEKTNDSSSSSEERAKEKKDS